VGALRDFRDFILRGNVVDLAVGIVIGVAFGTVITALVRDLITPLIGLFGHIDLSSYFFVVNGSKFAIGDFLNAVISFIIIAAVVFFLIVRPVNALLARYKKEPEPEDTRQCPYCMSTISNKATRCPQCTSQLPAAEVPTSIAS
jgi:large conductance mechanosensitive channel